VRTAFPAEGLTIGIVYRRGAGLFSVDGDNIVTAGFDIAKTVRYRNIQANPRATVVIDDLASVDPWTPRGIKVRGVALIEDDGKRFRITPEVIWSWGINEPKPGIPQIERRSVEP
jgi:pyridoxamine 5'-phosphate oxidase family protein